MTESWLTRHELMCVTGACHKRLGACPIWLGQVPYDWVLTYDWGRSHMTEACHRWLSHGWRVTNSCVSLSHVPYDWSMSFMSQILYYSAINSGVDASRTHVCHWVMSHMTDPCLPCHDSRIIQSRTQVLRRHELMCVTESCTIWLIHVLHFTNHILFSHKLKCWRVTNSCVTLSHVPYDWSTSFMSPITYYSVTNSSVNASRTHACQWVMHQWLIHVPHVTQSTYWSSIRSQFDEGVWLDTSAERHWSPQTWCCRLQWRYLSP